MNGPRGHGWWPGGALQAIPGEQRFLDLDFHGGSWIGLRCPPLYIATNPPHKPPRGRKIPENSHLPAESSRNPMFVRVSLSWPRSSAFIAQGVAYSVIASPTVSRMRCKPLAAGATTTGRAGNSCCEARPRQGPAGSGGPTAASRREKGGKRRHALAASARSPAPDEAEETRLDHASVPAEQLLSMGRQYGRHQSSGPIAWHSGQRSVDEGPSRSR